MFDDVGRSGVVAGVLAGGLLLATPVLAAAALGAWWLLREPATAPPRTYTFAVPVDQTRIGGVDLLALHRERFPAVVTAREPGARAAATRAVTEAVAGDAALVTVATQLLGSLEAGDTRATHDATDVWNAALSARGMPYALQAGGSPPHGYLKGYWLAAEPTVRAGERATTVRVGLRVDRLNVVEGWLGLAEEVGGAIVVVDRVRDFAAESLWPRLDPDDPAPLSVAVRADLGSRLEPGALAVLTRTAAAQRELRAAVTAVEGRRASCNSNFVLRVPWDGLDDLAQLRSWAAEFQGEPCPGITDAEVDAVNGGSLQLRAEPDLPAALEALTALAARHVALHEAQHRLDHEDWGFGTPPPCTACAGLSEGATTEASAYLAAFASGESTVAVVQACEVLAAGEGGRAVRALDRIFTLTGASCDAPLPDDFPARAGALAAEWFTHRDLLTLEAFPATLPLGLR
jgi:hypothetical protein